MPNLENKKIKDLHRCIVNIGGSNNGVIDSVLPLCDGNGYSTGIEMSNEKVNINTRRGVLSNFNKKGHSNYIVQRDMAFPNSSVGNVVTSENSVYTAELDRYSAARIHFVRDDFIFKLAIKSSYFEQGLDGIPTIVGYWQRGYGKNSYYIVEDGVGKAQSSIDESKYFLDPVPDDGFQIISGLIKKYGEIRGMRHPQSRIEYKLILSCEEDLNVQIANEIQIIRDFEGNDTAYDSVSSQISNILPLSYEYEKVNFDSFDITPYPKVFNLNIYNPTLWNIGVDYEETECDLYGKEVFPNVDLRFFQLVQSKNKVVRLLIEKI